MLSAAAHLLVRIPTFGLALLLVASALGTGPVLGVAAPEGAPTPPSEVELEAAASMELSDEATLTDVPDPGDLAQRVWDYAESLPPEDWNIEALAESLAYDRFAAFEFVRDYIRYEPYRGILRGAEGTLAARGGNSADRSLLLAALLDEMLVDYEYMTATLDDEGVTAVMAAATAGAPRQLDAELPGSRVDTRAAARRARRDYARISEALGERFPTGGGDDAAARNDARAHTWLRMAFDAQDLDLDTTLPDATPGMVLTSDGQASSSLPNDLRHYVELRILVEELDGGVLIERTLLDERLDAVDASSRELFLYFQPDLSGYAGAITSVLSGDERWAPVLMSDGEGTVGDGFSAGGSGVDILGDPTELPEIVSLRLVATTIGPGLQPQAATHVLFDRRLTPREPGAALSTDELQPLVSKDGAPLALARITHIMVSTGGASPRTYAYHQSQVLDLVAGALIDEELASNYSLSDRLWPLAVADQSLVFKSEQVTVPSAGGAGAHAYVARPRVYVTSIGPAPDDPDSLVQVTDLLIDSVRILPREPGQPTASERLWYGVMQSALETEAGLQRAAALEGGTRTLASASLSGDGPWRLAESIADIGADSHPALEADIDSGSLVVLVGDGSANDAWWSVDPQSGITRAMLRPGLRGFRDTTKDPERPVLDTNYTKVNLGGARQYTRPVHMRPPHRPGAYTPSRTPARPCSGGDEYLTVVGCVSLPVAVSYYGLQLVFVVAITAIAQTVWTDWLESAE